MSNFTVNQSGQIIRERYVTISERVRQLIAGNYGHDRHSICRDLEITSTQLSRALSQLRRRGLWAITDNGHSDGTLYLVDPSKMLRANGKYFMGVE